MTANDISDETLMALADGELGDQEAAAVRARIARDPALAERFADFAETRALLAPSAGAAADDAGLDRLAAAVRGEAAPRPWRFGVIEGGKEPPSIARVPVAAASAPAPRIAPRSAIWRPALAASVALVVGGVLGYGLGPRGGGDGLDGISVAHGSAAEQALASALETGASGATVAWSDPARGVSGTVRLVASHRIGDVRFCREYEFAITGEPSRIAGVGCRSGDGRWTTEIAVAEPNSGEGYGTASGTGLLQQGLSELGSDGALSPEKEADALRRKWTAN